MKNFKKFLCMFLALTLIVTSFAAISVMAEETTEETTEAVETTKFPDVPKSAKYADAVEVLNKLSIINGYEDGTFKPENNVTRAEFAALLLRMLGMDQSMAPLQDPFPDVPTNFWAAGTIDAAKRLGIITGYDDGTFGPGNNVAYEEALTMIIRAINYSNYSAPGEMWYSTYVDSANRLDITKNAIGNVGNPASRACIAQFIFNTLEVNVRENDIIRDNTIMEKHLGIERKEGIIASNSYTSLKTPDVNLKENEVMIMDVVTGLTETYKVENLNEYDDMIGAKVTFYSRASKNSAYDELVMFSVKKSVEKQTIDASLLEENKCDDTTISYYKSKKATTTSSFSLDSKNVVIFNGKLYGDTPTLSGFAEVLADGKLPKIGQISVLNRDNDNDIDVIFIDAYEHYAVSSVVSSTYTVTDKITSTEGKSVVLDYTDDDQQMAFVNTNGSKLSFSSIRKNVAIAVKESNPNSGTKLVTVVIMDKTVSGEVSAISSSGLKIGSTEYEYSSIAAWKRDSELKAPEKGGKYTFFLDVNGKIFAYVKNESAEDGAKYGFIIGFRGNKDNAMSDEPIYLQILTQTGTKQWIPFAKNTKINGHSIEGDYEGAERTLMEEAEKQNKAGLINQAARQLVKYTLKTSSGTTVFDEITTVTDEEDTTGSSEVDDDELKMFGGFKSDVEAKYTSSSKVFKAGGTNLYLGSAIVFVVPEDMSKADNYKKGSSSDFKNNKNYYIEAFDISTSKTAKVVVLYGGSSVTEVDSQTAVFRVEASYSEENPSKGETMLKITGYENGSTTLKEYWVSPSSEDDIEALATGDMVRFGLDAEGFVTLADEDILYTEDTDPYYFAWDHDFNSGNRPVTESALKTAREYDSAEFKFIYGTLYSVDDDHVIIVVDTDDDVSDLQIAFRADVSRFSGTKFYEYDTEESPVEVRALEGDYKEILDSLANYTENDDAAAKVIVHSAFSSVKSLTVIK